MAADYPIRTIGEVCYVTDGAHAKVERREHGVPYLTSKNIGVGRLLLDTLDFISEEDFERLFANTSRAQRRPTPGDVLIGIIGTFGNAYLYRDSDQFGISSAIALLRPGTGKIYPRFLYYVVTNPAFKDAHSAYKSGSVQGYTNIPTIERLPVPVPPLPEQCAIAHILGTLDDKIELNRGMNETLEAMARALFQSWFVEFAPVRAKAEGRDPGLPKEIAALFPDRFEDSELGEIPAGWGAGSLEDIASVTMGLSPEGASCNSAGVGTPLINGPVEFGDHFPVKSKWTTSPTRLAEVGDLILCVRGSTTGRRVVADGSYCLGRGVCAIRSKSGARAFLYQAVNSGLDRLLSKTTGSVFPNLSAPDIKGFQILVPSTGLIEVFDCIAEPLTERAEASVRESRTLAALRDTLLPKLISGELQVKDAERTIEVA